MKPALIPKALFSATWGRSSDLGLYLPPSHQTERPTVALWQASNRHSSGNCTGFTPDSLLSPFGHHISLAKIINYFLLKKVGDVKAIWAFVLTLVAMHAILDQLHLLSPFLGEIDAQRGTAQEETHPVAVVDLDTHGAWHAIATTPAEITRKCLALLLHFLPSG